MYLEIGLLSSLNRLSEEAKVREGGYNVSGGILPRIPLYVKSVITSPPTLMRSFITRKYDQPDQYILRV